jgi:hypothetical protein
VAARARAHGVDGAILAGLRAAGGHADGERALHAGDLARRVRVAALWDALEEVVPALAGAGVPVVALKGPVLAERLYPDPSARWSSDLDLLVPPDRLAQATRVLEALGYRRAPYQLYPWMHHVCFGRAGHPWIELHYRLLYDLGAPLELEHFAPRLRPHRTPKGAPLSVLAPEDELVYLAIHAAASSFARLGWLYDLKLLIERYRIDWGLALARAHRLHVRVALESAALLLRERLGVPIGQARAPWRSRVVRSLLPRSDDHKIINGFIRLVMCDTPATGMTFVRQRLQSALALGLDS